MKTWQQTPISATPIAATLALLTVLALGGAGGYALRAFAQSPDVAPAAATTESHRIVNPGIGLHRAALEDRTSGASIPDAPGGLGPVGAHNQGIGLHQLDREELP